MKGGRKEEAGCCGFDYRQCSFLLPFSCWCLAGAACLTPPAPHFPPRRRMFMRRRSNIFGVNKRR